MFGDPLPEVEIVPVASSEVLPEPSTPVRRIGSSKKSSRELDPVPWIFLVILIELVAVDLDAEQLASGAP